MRSYHLGAGLVQCGHEVTMITAHHGGREIHQIAGMTVHYLPVPYTNHFGVAKRIWAFLRFVWLSKQLIRTLPKPDLVYVMTTPLTTGWIGLFAKRHFNVPFYFEVGDLWPEAPIKMGAIRNPLIQRWLYRFEQKCYFEARRVVALSPAIRNHIEAVSPETKVHVLTNISDNETFQPHFRTAPISAAAPLHVAYIGTFGQANDLEYLLKVAETAEKQQMPIRFSLMGDGAQFQHIQKAARALATVQVLPFGNTHAVASLLETVDAVYVSFKNVEILNTGSPNKFFDGLAAGKLIIINFGGWIRGVIEKNGCGFYHDPLQPDSFMGKIEPYLQDQQLLLQAQQKARLLAERYYDKHLQIQKLDRILRNEKQLRIHEDEVYILTA